MILIVYCVQSFFNPMRAVFVSFESLRHVNNLSVMYFWNWNTQLMIWTNLYM